MLKRLTDWPIEQLNKFLTSKVGFYVALIGPLAVIPASQGVRNVENLISSNWVQLWALFALGVMQSKHHKKVEKHLGIS